MALFQTAAVIVLLCEIVLAVFAVSPVHSLRRLSYRTVGVFRIQHLTYVIQLLMLCALGVCIDAIWGRYALSKLPQLSHLDEVRSCEHQARYLLYGAIVVVMLALGRIHDDTRDLDRLTQDRNFLKKQAEQQQKEYMRLQQEKEAPKTAEQSDYENQIKELKEQVTLLKKTAATAEKESKTALSSLEMLKKQAASQQTEYDRLMEENRSLQTKLEDFELVLGDAKKKRV
eukprot:GILK01001682.1.p2 GENE.GILK01001682.1~~GILK01001682.1.p2  ORF type:complete len:238 (-),score=41.28 GILK01001682.1:1052-1738(-)